jgi:hypothetical protein
LVAAGLRGGRARTYRSHDDNVWLRSVSEVEGENDDFTMQSEKGGQRLGVDKWRKLVDEEQEEERETRMIWD